MSLFDKLGQNQRQSVNPQQMQANMRQEIGKISSHPASYLKDKGYNIPDGMTDAKQITQYLLQTGQVGTPRLQQVVSMLNGGRR